MTMKNQLPAGPRMPAVLQTLGTWNRPTAFLSRCRARYGKRFTIRSLEQTRMKFSVRPYASLREHTA
jgi:hypothetical protein